MMKKKNKKKKKKRREKKKEKKNKEREHEKKDFWRKEGPNPVNLQETAFLGVSQNKNPK